MKLNKEVENRKNSYDVSPIFLNRWSPRAMNGESISDEDIGALFEAARWAPSAFNEQPWRFIVSKRDSDSWDQFLEFLMEGNRIWCKDASALVLVLSKKTLSYDGSYNRNHSFDTGAACENLALEGSIRDLVVHAMAGVHYDLARDYLKLSDEFEIECMLVIGKRGKIEDLPEKYQPREFPSLRKDLDEIVFYDNLN